MRRAVMSGGCVLLLAACATPPPASAPPQRSTSQSCQSVYWRGAHDALQDLQSDPATHVSHKALAPCPKSVAWQSPADLINIPRILILDALRKEESRYAECAARHAELGDEVKATLGEIRRGQ